MGDCHGIYSQNERACACQPRGCGRKLRAAQNVANTLPFAGTLDAPVRVAVFGIGQIFTPTGLSGMDPWRQSRDSGRLERRQRRRTDTLLAHKYRAWALEHPEGSEMPLGNLSMEEFASLNDAAVDRSGALGGAL